MFGEDFFLRIWKEVNIKQKIMMNYKTDFEDNQIENKL